MTRRRRYLFLLVAVAGVDEGEVGAGEIPVMGDVFNCFDQVEADQASTRAAGRKGFACQNDDFVVPSVSGVVHTVQTRDGSGVARMMPVVVLLRLTQEERPQNYKDGPPECRWL